MATYRGVAIDLEPTEGMREEAARYQAWKAEGREGGTAVAATRARQILSGDELSPETVITMAAWFARHAVDAAGEGFEPGEEGYPSPGRVAWAAWGGDPGQRWSTAKRAALAAIDDEADMSEERSTSDEPRAIKAMACAYKALDGEAREFEGYGSVFGVVDSYQDVVLPGAFQATLAKAMATSRMPAMLWQHDPSQVIGVWRVMQEDSRGLYVKGELADTQLGREAYALLKLGALSGLSIGYSVTGERYDRTRDVRELTGIELWETSLVTFPANAESRVAAVKDAQALGYRGLERILREAGLSRSEAKAIASGGMRALRDAADVDLAAEDAAAIRALYR